MKTFKELMINLDTNLTMAYITSVPDKLVPEFVLGRYKSDIKKLNMQIRPLKKEIKRKWENHKIVGRKVDGMLRIKT